MEERLTVKQIRFCKEYIIDGHGTRSALAAGYSPESAHVIATENLNKPKIREYLEELQQDMVSASQITKEKLLRAYTALAFYDPRKFFDEAGNVKNINELDDQTAFALAGFDVAELFGPDGPVGITKKIKLADRRAALDGIAKMLGYNAAEKKELSGPGGAPLQIESQHKIIFEDYVGDSYHAEQPGEDNNDTDEPGI